MAEQYGVYLRKRKHEDWELVERFVGVPLREVVASIERAVTGANGEGHDEAEGGHRSFTEDAEIQPSLPGDMVLEDMRGKDIGQGRA